MVSRRRMTATLVWVVGLSFCLSAQRPNYSDSWQPDPKVLRIPNGHFRLSLNDLPNPHEFVIGVRANKEKEGKLVAGEVFLTQISSKHRAPKTVDWPDKEIKIGVGSVALSGLARARGALLLYFTVPQGTEVRIFGNDKLMTAVKVTSSLLIQNGEVVSIDVEGVGTLLRRLTNIQEPSKNLE